MVKNPSASAGNARDVSSIPGSGRSPGEGNSSILAWEIPWAQELGGLQSMGSRRVRYHLATKQQQFFVYSPDRY